MRERGMSCAAIARILRVSEGLISWHCLVQGADPPGSRPLNAVARGPQVMRRGNHHVRRFTPAEDERLLALERDGLKLDVIAKRLGRPRNSVLGRLYTLARHEARAELSPPVAQRMERRASNAKVAGSSPAGRATS
jgi:hypothetical protein